MKKYQTLFAFVYLFYSVVSNASPEIKICGDLLLSQRKVQVGGKKELGRTLAEYNEYIYQLDEWRELSLNNDEGSIFSLKDIFQRSNNLVELIKLFGMMKQKPVNWADFGSGLAVPMREFAMYGLVPPANLRMTAVDLFDWEHQADVATKKFIAQIKTYAKAVVGKDIFKSRFRPNLIEVDATKVSFADSTRPDIITSIESIQYIPDKVAYIVNAYNQLADEGILVISARHFWPTSIRVVGTIHEGREIFLDFLGVLKNSNIPFLLSGNDRNAPLSRSRVLVLQRRAGTVLNFKREFVHVSENEFGYAVSFYAAPR